MDTTDVRRGLGSQRRVTRATEAGGDGLERRIDETARLLMTHDPSPRAYAAVLDDIRRRPPARPHPQTGLSWVIAASACAATVLLALVALQTFLPAIYGAQVDGSAGGGLLMHLSNTRFARWINESGSLFGYPGFLFFHSLGLAIVVGVSTAVSLRLIGFAPGVPLGSVRGLFPVIWLGFCVSAVSGAILFVADASGKTQNVVFEVKLVLVAFGVMTIALIQRRLFRSEAIEMEGQSRLLAIFSLLIWLAAIVAGRLVAYVL